MSVPGLPDGAIVAAEGVDTTRTTRVVGVSVEVPDPDGHYLRRARVAFGDPAGDVVPAHVTLLPPTEVTPAQAEELERHLAHVAASHEPFLMKLRGTGTFRPVSPVVYIQVAQGVSSCERLERAVRSGPVRRELTFPYHPHVTVAHQIDESGLDRAFDELADYTATFTVEHFRYYELGDDEQWHLVADYVLGGP